MNAQPFVASARAIAKHSAHHLSLGLAAAATVIGMALPTLAQPATLTARETNSWINVRDDASTQANVQHLGRPGDRVETIVQRRGQDGYTWYYVQFASSRAQGWVREDLLRLESSNRTTTTTATQPRVATAPSTQRPAQTAPTYTQAQIDYFMEVALGSEFGSTNASVKKWDSPIRIKVNGTPTAEDRATLQAVVSELAQLTRLDIQLSDRNPNIELYFVPESQFSRYEPNYHPTNLGFFWTWWNGNTINRARVLIATEGVNQQERSHLIREELTQSLGLMQDSIRYSDSIFYQPWTSVTTYSDMDRAVISLLYNPAIRAGMTRTQVATAVNQITVAQGVAR